MQPGKSFYIEFLNFDSVVGQYKGISVSPESQSSSVLRLSLTGGNKAKIVDYLNGSVAVLSENMLKRKNLLQQKQSGLLTVASR